MPQVFDSQEATSSTDTLVESSQTIHKQPKRGRKPPSPVPPNASIDGIGLGETRNPRDSSVSSRASTHSRSLSLSPERSPSRQPLLDPAFEEELSVPAVSVTPTGPPSYGDAIQGPNYGAIPDSVPRDRPSLSSTSDLQRSTILRNEGPFPRSPQYGTIDNVFRTRDIPEDMGGSEAPLLGHASERRRKRRRRQCCGICCCNGNKIGKYLIVAVVLLIVVPVVVQLGLKLHSNKASKNNDVTNPDPEVGVEQCPEATMNKNFQFWFDDEREFTFLESVRNTYVDTDSVPIRTIGSVQVRAAHPSFLMNRVRVDIVARSTDSTILDEMVFQRNLNGQLKFEPASHMGGSENGTSRPCVVIDATVWVKAKVSMEGLVVSTRNLGINYVKSSDSYPLVAETLSIQSNNGIVRFPNSQRLTCLNSRRIIIKTNSGRIEGTYPLFDLLSVTSNSGSVKINVDPKEHYEHQSEIAELKANSNSGSIELYYPSVKRSLTWLQGLVPDRNYNSRIVTNSGQIQIDHMPHGSQTELISNSGTIKALVVPTGPRDELSNIYATSHSGVIDLDLSPHLFQPRKSITNLNGRFIPSSSLLKVHFPSTWEGELWGYTASGSVSIAWPGMKIFGSQLPLEDFFDMGHIYRGRKGHGNGTLTFIGVSGNVELSADDNDD